MSKADIEKIKQGIDDLLYTINSLSFNNDNEKALFCMTVFCRGAKDSLDELVGDEDE